MRTGTFGPWPLWESVLWEQLPFSQRGSPRVWVWTLPGKLLFLSSDWKPIGWFLSSEALRSHSESLWMQPSDLTDDHSLDHPRCILTLSLANAFTRPWHYPTHLTTTAYPWDSCKEHTFFKKKNPNVLLWAGYKMHFILHVHFDHSLVASWSIVLRRILKCCDHLVMGTRRLRLIIL